MNRVGNIVGLILILLGTLWVFQGIGVVGGSFMTGQTQWVAIGAVTALIGIVAMIWVNRRVTPRR